MMIASDLKGILSISPVKSRYDTFSDQYNRVLMVKLLLVLTVIMGVSWYKDAVTCIVPGGDLNEEFVSAACWIQGMYVYKELQGRSDPVAYFGMPMSMDNEGMIEGTRDLCNLRPKLNAQPSPRCKHMTKTFYLQYQWMPFVIGALSILYFIPYVVFLHGNRDMNKLKDMIKADEDNTAEKIVKNFFHVYNPKINTHRLLFLRIVVNIICKILYVAVNFVTIIVLDNVLNGDYIWYGVKWFEWTRLENSMAYDYMGARDVPKPGNVLLPPFGYCEMIESAKDIKITLSNRHKFVCELSQHILYQYCLFVLWVAIVIGILLTILGLIQIFIHYIFIAIGVRNDNIAGKKLSRILKIREIEYLDFIKSKDVGLLEEVLDKLSHKLKDDCDIPLSDSNESLDKPPPVRYY